MKKVLFYITYSFLWVVAWLPLPLLYVISDITYFLIYHVARYRVKTTRENLLNAFPEKTKQERHKLEQKFYHHLCDYGFETIRFIHISEAEIRRRITFENTELLEKFAAQGDSIIALFGHYCNWEWVASLPLHFNNTISVSTLYKTLKNKDFDQFFIDLRSRFGTYCYPKQKVLRGMAELKKQNKQFVLAFIADQTPSWNNLHYWTTWLNQETPFLTGWESIARKTNYPVVFLEMHKVKRGYYQCKLELLCENPKETAPFELTEKYARRMERNILVAPEFWLWSHKRWKYHKN
ncbi:MAG TPA: lysophospholipid acyltransferase family protein [Paludibacteraceae bacterium]|nr:lysophospholipid acyltransferase family protein [Paludibacteraceae bacterium]